jgi:hypothetical protein
MERAHGQSHTPQRHNVCKASDVQIIIRHYLFLDLPEVV